MRAIQVTQIGGPEVLEWVELADPAPGPGQLVIDVDTAGVNFIDTYQRTGVYDRPLPFTPDLEIAGVVSAAANDVEGFTPGDRVVTVEADGGYAEKSLIDAAGALPVPVAVPLRTAAAVALQGFTAHYLAHDTFRLEPGNRCLVHAGAGGVGGLLIQIAKHRGAEVFATVGTEEKATVAAAAGADHVIRYRDVDFTDAVRDTLGDEGLDAVYDGVGRDTFDAGLTLLRPRGLMALFGGASGHVPPFELQRLNQNGSLFVTRPSLLHHMAPAEA